MYVDRITLLLSVIRNNFETNTAKPFKVIKSYKNLSKVTKSYKKLQKVIKSYKKLQKVIKSYPKTYN